MKQLSVVTLVNLPAPPASAIQGDQYYDTTLQAVQVYTSSGWQSTGSGAAAPAPPIASFIYFS